MSRVPVAITSQIFGDKSAGFDNSSEFGAGMTGSTASAPLSVFF